MQYIPVIFFEVQLHLGIIYIYIYIYANTKQVVRCLTTQNILLTVIYCLLIEFTHLQCDLLYVAH